MFKIVDGFDDKVYDLCDFLNYPIPSFSAGSWDGMINIIDFCAVKQTLSKQVANRTRISVVSA